MFTIYGIEERKIRTIFLYPAARQTNRRQHKGPAICKESNVSDEKSLNPLLASSVIRIGEPFVYEDYAKLRRLFMRFVRFISKQNLHMGLCDGKYVIDLTNIDFSSCGSFLEMVSFAGKKNLTLDEFISNLIQNHDGDFPRLRYGDLEKKDGFDKRLVLPFEPPEVWGCGVTYVRSKKAREYETEAKGVYDLVYDAKRPEIFFKATASRCAGPYDDIYIRGDSNWSVPEPELAFIVGTENSIVGFTAGNDISARDIEGENPLYLPQAKIFKGCCALGPSVVTVDEVGLEPSLEITCTIFREGKIIFEQSTHTSRMKRSFEELRRYLVRFNPVPAGTVCLTGTGIVPPNDFSLHENDIVEIEIERIGVLKNRVVVSTM